MEAAGTRRHTRRRLVRRASRAGAVVSQLKCFLRECAWRWWEELEGGGSGAAITYMDGGGRGVSGNGGSFESRQHTPTSDIAFIRTLPPSTGSTTQISITKIGPASFYTTA